MNSGKIDKLGRWSWRERLENAAWDAALFPIWFPANIVKDFLYARRTGAYVKYDARTAWAKVCHRWSKATRVYGVEVGPSLRTPLEHELVEAFVRRHPRTAGLALFALADENAYVSAYAFKCLIRLQRTRPEDLALMILNRTDRVQTLLAGCFAEEISLGDFFWRYWGSKSEENAAARRRNHSD